MASYMLQAIALQFISRNLGRDMHINHTNCVVLQLSSFLLDTFEAGVSVALV
jgi:hypothetical protein